jgi:hypothetical protein
MLGSMGVASSLRSSLVPVVVVLLSVIDDLSE